MALQDCINKLGVVSKADRERLQEFLDEGLTDQQAVRRLLVESSANVVEIADRAREAGATVAVPTEGLAEVRDIQDKKLRGLIAKRTEIEGELAALQAEYTDLNQNATMFEQILAQKAPLHDMMENLDDNDLLLRISQAMFDANTRDGLKRGVLGFQGETPRQVLASYHEQRNKRLENRKQHILLMGDFQKVKEQVNQIIAATPETQTFFQMEGLGYQLGLFSALEKGARDMNLPEWKAGKPASGKNILAKLRKMPGVKMEEMKWTGIVEFLDSAEKFTREDVQTFIRENGVQLEETVTDPNLVSAQEDLRWDDGQIWDDPEAYEHIVEDEMYEFRRAYPPDPQDDFYFFDPDAFLGEMEDTVAEDYGFSEDDKERLDRTGNTLAEVAADYGYDVWADYETDIMDAAQEAAEQYAYESYMDNPYYIYEASTDAEDIYIFGNEDTGYSIRVGDWRSYSSQINQTEIYSLNEAQLQAEAHARDEGWLADEDDIYAPRWADYVGGIFDNYREVKIKLPQLSPEFYETMHFGDEENIVMFMRVTDRMLPDGPTFKRSLGLGEAQDPAELNLREVTHTEARIAHELGHLVIYGTPAETGTNLTPMKEVMSDSVKNMFFKEDRHTFYLPTRVGRTQDTYVIDEAQSDWHQQGRETGYADVDVALELDERATEAGRRLGEISDSLYAEFKESAIWDAMEEGIRPNAGDFRAAMNLVSSRTNPLQAELGVNAQAWITQSGDREMILEYKRLQQERKALREEKFEAEQGVTDAPFKDDNWLALGIKRAIISAVEEGKDQLAWADADVLENRWGNRYRQLYDNQYDKKMPSIVKKLTGIEPKHIGPDGAPSRPGEMGHWVIPITPELIEQVEQEGFAYMQDKKGLIEFDRETGRATIGLLEAADFSTFIHEAGHLYLELLGTLAEQMDAPEAIMRDWQQVLSYLNVRNKDEITTEHHELWARSFEKYAMDGQAPAIALQDAFNAFRRWLGQIYRRIAGVRDIELPDEIRGVMDRILATDTEIQLAENRQELGPIFQTAEEMDVSPEVFEVYKQSLARAHDEAVQAETIKMLEAMKRDQMAWWKEESAKVQKEVEEEIHARRVYQAISMLTKGKQPDGSPTRMAPFKLDRDSLLEIFQGDTEMLKLLPHTGAYGIYRREGGVDVDVAAQALGYMDGREMMDAILNAEPMDLVIKRETKRRMEQLYPDPFKDGSLAADAVNAVHNERRANVLAAEMRALRKLQRRDRPIVRAEEQAARREEREEAQIAKEWILPKRAEVAMIKAAARQSIGEKQIRNVNPNAYLRQERKAGRLAFEAMERKDYATAYMYKRMQLVNHEMYRAAVRAKDQSAKNQKYLSKFESKRVQQRLGRSDVLEKILTVIEGVDFRKRSLRSIDRQKIEKELAIAVEEGELVMPPGVLERIFDDRVNWQELTIDEFNAMRDLVKQLEKQARAEVEAIVMGEKVNIERRAGEVAEQLYENQEVIDLGVAESTKREKGKKALKQGVSAWLRPSSIARILDKAGFGAVTRNIIVPMRRAYSERLIPELHRAQADVAKLYDKHFTKKQLRLMHRKQIRIEAQNESYSHSDLLSLALNWGNEGNRQAILGGKKRDGSPAFTQAGVDQMLAQLTENDWAFVQEVWDYLDTYWPDLRDAEKRRRGIAPQKVASLPFTIRTVDGTEVSLRGGYYPLKYAVEHSDRVKLEQYEDHYKNMGNGVYVTANTRAGATHERVRNHGRTVRLSLNVLDNHLREVIRDITIGDEVNYLKRLLANKELRDAFYRTGNETALDTLNLWLTDAAVGELPAEGFWEGTTAWIRTGFTKAKLGWNLMTTMLQFTGWTQSMAVIGSANMAIGLGKFMKNPSVMWTDVMTRSKFLSTRYEVGAWNKDVQDARAHLESFFGTTPTRLRVSMNWLAHTYFLPIAKAQQVVDITTWLGAYEKGRNELNLSEADATIYADTQVEAAQTSGFFSDRSGLERGTLGLRKNRQSQYIRIWTTLISYMLAKGNIAYEKTKNTNFRKPSEVLSYFTDLVLLFTVEGIASALLYGQLPEDDDTEDWVAWGATATAESIVAGIPFVREIPSSRFSGGNTPLGSFAKDLYQLGVQIEQGENDEAMRRALYNVTGTAFHIPSGQLGRTLEAIWFEDDPEWWQYISGVRED